MARRWKSLEREIVGCERCPRLREHCRTVARVKRRAYRDEEYWSRPLPGFGDRAARVLLVGLAPAAHGANRTGRMFTGDRSGEWLYGALFRTGMASQAESDSRDDGMQLHGAYITAACRCAPPANKPTTEELQQCSGYLDREFELLEELKVVVALGKIGWDTVLRRALRVDPAGVSRPRPRFGHGADTAVVLTAGRRALPLVGTYHPSQQNTFTGRLTRPMLDDVLRKAARIGGLSGRRQGRGRP